MLLPLLAKCRSFLAGLALAISITAPAHAGLIITPTFDATITGDAIASRDDGDRDVALRRMEQAGAVLTTAETAAFEWLGTAAAPARSTAPCGIPAWLPNPAARTSAP